MDSSFEPRPLRRLITAGSGGERNQSMDRLRTAATLTSSSESSFRSPDSTLVIAVRSSFTAAASSAWLNWETLRASAILAPSSCQPLSACAMVRK